MPVHEDEHSGEGVQRAAEQWGQPETVRYEAINAMLLNEFLKQHKKVDEQQTMIAELKSSLAQQQKRSKRPSPSSGGNCDLGSIS
jgi:hypothetical protein